MIHGPFDPEDCETCVACAIAPETPASFFVREVLSHPAVASVSAEWNLTDRGAERLGEVGIEPLTEVSPAQAAVLLEKLCEVLPPFARLESDGAREVMENYGDIHAWLAEQQSAKNLAGLGDLTLEIGFTDLKNLNEDEQAEFTRFAEQLEFELEEDEDDTSERECILVYDVGDMHKLATTAYLLQGEDISETPLTPGSAILDFQNVSPALLPLIAWIVRKAGGKDAFLFMPEAG